MASDLNSIIIVTSNIDNVGAPNSMANMYRDISVTIIVNIHIDIATTSLGPTNIIITITITITSNINITMICTMHNACGESYYCDH